VSDHAKGLRKKSVEKKWYRLRTIGEGACGTVWLEVDQEGKGTAAERAVKEMRKSRMRMLKIDIERELLAMTKLSKVSYSYSCKLLGFLNPANPILIHALVPRPRTLRQLIWMV
jgi:hypothetical protein